MEFLLDPNVVFLNHGSFGACPREVHDEYQRIQRELETQPVYFMQQTLPGMLSAARACLAEFVGAEHDELVFVTNPTYAVNALARCLELGPGDELLTSNHEYGACMNAWRFMQQRAGFEIVQQTIELPVSSDQEIVESIWSGTTDRTKVIFLSHITSPTALTLPVAEICRRAKDRNILTIIDGAHVPGQLELDIKQVDADFYVGTCHKWLCAPKGSSFFYARQSLQHLIEPLVVGWGWGDVERKFDSGKDFTDYFEWLGTHDPSAHLTVPKAIAFQAEHDWLEVRKQCHELAVHAIELVGKLPGVQRVHANEFFQQMALIELPPTTSADQLKRELWQAHRIEVPVIPWRDRVFVRISVQAYNSESDIERLLEGLRLVLA